MSSDEREVQFEQFKQVYKDEVVLKEMLNQMSLEEFLVWLVENTNVNKQDDFKDLELELFAEYKEEVEQ